jgi:hypothetical protein
LMALRSVSLKRRDQRLFIIWRVAGCEDASGISNLLNTLTIS